MAGGLSCRALSPSTIFSDLFRAPAVEDAQFTAGAATSDSETDIHRGFNVSIPIPVELDRGLTLYWAELLCATAGSAVAAADAGLPVLPPLLPVDSLPA